MKFLLLSATLLASTGAMAAPDAPTTPQQNPFASQSSPYEKLTQTAKSQFDAKDFVGAQKSLEQTLVLAQTPKEKFEALRRLGQTHDAQEQYGIARELWQKALPLVEDSPSDLTLLNLLIGQSYYKQEKWQSFLDIALPMLNDFRADEESTKSAFRFQLADAYSNLKQEEKAREQLTLAIENEATPAQLRALAQITLGQSYQKSQEWDKARQYYEAITKIEGVSGDILIGAYDSLGEVAEKQNRAEDAKQAFANARSLWMQKADGQYKAKDWKGAIESYKSALKTGVPEPKIELVAHMQLGSAYESLGDTDASIAEFKYVVDTDPSASDSSQPDVLKTLKPLALVSLARGYIAQKKFEPARVELNRFMDYRDNMFAMFLRPEVERLLKSLPPKQ